MAAVEQTDETCFAFGKLDGLQPDAVTRFVIGEDAAPRVFSAEEAVAELGDPFATLVLLQGVFPRTAEEALTKLAEAAPEKDPLTTHQSFVLGEASQLAELPVEAQSMRFVVATAPNPGDIGPDVIISAPDPADGFVELMAWDRVIGGFNYYRTVGADSAWVFAGNSKHALTDPTQNKGPFESHKSGAPVMKELEIPWVHWSSFREITGPSVFARSDARRDHPWFTEKMGAEDLETELVMPAMTRWARARFERITQPDGQIADPGRILTQLTETHTVNLVSSQTASRDLTADEPVDLPPHFFFDVRALAGPAKDGGSPVIGLTVPNEFAVASELYEASVQEFALVSTDGGQVSIPGDAHFAFVVPSRAHEDQVVLEEAMRVGLLTRRLAAALLMVDFPNPIFSERRKALQKFVPEKAIVKDQSSTFSQEMADNILAAAVASPEGSPEREFAERWEVGENLKDPFEALLRDYAQQVVGHLQTQQGINDYTQLATSRRERCRREMPILSESSLAMPRTNLPDAELQMAADGTVTEINS